jgi:hypothetical protein
LKLDHLRDTGALQSGKKWISTAIGANTEVDNLNKTCVEIMNKFYDIRSLYYDKPVEKKFRYITWNLRIALKAITVVF